jgi:large subunit ribosomal protein L24
MVFKSSWNASVQPRKQRAYRRDAPIHIQGSFIVSHLSPALRKKYGTRSIRLRKGDKVVVARGDFKGKGGKVELINVKAEKVYVTGIEITKKDGSKVMRPVNPSNLVIEELDTSDKRRLKKWSKAT